MTAHADRHTLPIVILGGAFSWPGVYAGMRRTLEACAGVPVSVVPVHPADWAIAVTEYGWQRILRKVDREVRRMTADTGRPRVVLVGHSAGGVVGRLYLSPEPFRGDTYAGLERVAQLITLGSPNTNQRIGPMRRWVDARYPGACFSPAVRYTSVAGRRLEGRRHGTPAQRAAHSAYRTLSGYGAVWGDGLVPVSVALLPGAGAVVLDDVGHGPVLSRPWYGTAEIVRRWWAAAAGERP
jgi:pimeloyl-ACP methyl ester carboxylesterase